MDKNNKDIDLPSGAKLHISMASYATSKQLLDACLKEMKSLKIDSQAEIDVNLFKDLFCAGFSSPEIDKALWACMTKATYNSVRITPDTFEPVEAREDFLIVCWEVALFNILPFTKSLSQQYSRIQDLISPLQKSK